MKNNRIVMEFPVFYCCCEVSDLLFVSTWFKDFFMPSVSPVFLTANAQRN